ncbi:hypothetical protein [Paucibacter soli]|uniref:hypothetical protein n=1 Tax=Paucibacter soli TaxID=3133433 RepID=UPI0030A390A4
MIINKKTLGALGLALLNGMASAADVGVSVSIGQPGFYGRIDIGNMPQPPQVVVAQPIWVQRSPGRVLQPIYLRVPPGHQKNWAKHCGRYDACGVPVYFVKEDWYARQYRGDGDDRRDETEHGHKNHGKGHDKHRD